MRRNLKKARYWELKGLTIGKTLTCRTKIAYLMRCEDRETYQCYPSYETIGEAIGKTKNTVMKYVRGLEEKHFIFTETTTVWGEGGKKRNANLKFTIRPIEELSDIMQTNERGDRLCRKAITSHAENWISATS